MKIPFLFISFLVLSAGSSVAATDNSELELGDLCGSYTYQVLKPIADELQKEQLKNNCDDKEGEINDLREKVEHLERKKTEEKFKDLLITSKDNHINVLQTRISELQNTNNVIKQVVGSVNQEIVQLKSFIKEELKLSQIHQLNKNSQTYAESSIQMKYMEETLESCQLNLNKTQNAVSEYKDLFENKKIIIADNAAMISQLEAQVKSNQLRLNEYQVDLNNKQEIIKQKEEEISKLKEQIKMRENGMGGISCIHYGDSNSVNDIVILNFKPFRALCNSEIAGPGWIVIQQRLNGEEYFNRKWKSFKQGFGDFAGDFFLGLENIHRLTSNRPHELYIHMETLSGSTFYARYNNFTVAGEADKYRLLSLGSYSGTADWDRMRASEHKVFSTFDSENDSAYVTCAETQQAGWWYGQSPCSNCNLNVRYETLRYNKGCVSWSPYLTLTTIKMLIRPRGNQM